MLGGVSDHGTYQEDDPVTWEASPFLGANQAKRGACQNLRRAEGRGCTPSRYRRSARPEVGRAARDNRSGGRRRRGVGGPNRSEDVGERLAPGPGRAEGGPC